MDRIARSTGIRRQVLTAIGSEDVSPMMRIQSRDNVDSKVPASSTGCRGNLIIATDLLASRT